MQVENGAARSSSDLDFLQNSASRTQPAEELGRDDFLQLLMTQLNQQDPLSPMDNTQFVAQLAQFANLERLNWIAESVQNLALSQTSSTSAQMVSFIGRDVEVVSSKIIVGAEGGDRSLAFRLDTEAAEVTATIRDENGTVVRTIELGHRDEGDNTASWDGNDNDGNPVGEGEYTVTYTARDDEDGSVGVSARRTARVEGVGYENGLPVLILEGEESVRLGDVRRVLDGDE